LREVLEEPLLVSAPVNVRYLTGFESTNAAVLVEPERVRLFTDFRYAERARELEDVEVEETKRYLYSDLPDRLPKPVGFEADAVTFANYEFLREGGLELVPRRGLVESLRAVKEPQEIDAIRRASEVTDRTYERLVEESFAGRTEKELVWRMHQLFHESGADGLAFDIDIAAGLTAASPHALPGDRVVQEGDLVLVDAGAVVDGYCSDCTRTFAVGEISDSLRGLYEVVREAQQAGVDAVKAGVTGRDADAAARAVIADAGYGENFGHGLGHGLGLLVHEAPYLRPEWEEELAAGNVVTVEPGVYLSGVAGIRIEDLVVVTEDGCEVLTSFPKELTTVH
jgi:Xaa-Pro aminopeptidase